jgi:hypothetical protein
MASAGAGLQARAFSFFSFFILEVIIARFTPLR